MQTFFLIFEDEQVEGSDLITMNSGHSIYSRSSFAMTGTFSEGFSPRLHRPSVRSLQPNAKQQRLIDWNVDVLQGLLKKVLAMRSCERTIPIPKIAKMRIERKPGKMVIDEVWFIVG